MMVELSFHGMSGMTQAVGMFVGVDSVLMTVVARMGVVCSWVAGGGDRDRDLDGVVRRAGAGSRVCYYVCGCVSSRYLHAMEF